MKNKGFTYRTVQLFSSSSPVTEVKSAIERGRWASEVEWRRLISQTIYADGTGLCIMNFKFPLPFNIYKTIFVGVAFHSLAAVVVASLSSPSAAD